MSVDNIAPDIVETMGLVTGTTLEQDHQSVLDRLPTHIAGIEGRSESLDNLSNRATFAVYFGRGKVFHERALGVFQSAAAMEAGSADHVDAVARARAFLAEAMNWLGIADGIVDILIDLELQLEQIEEELADKDNNRNQRRLFRSARGMIGKVQSVLAEASKEETLDKAVAKLWTQRTALEAIEKRIHEDAPDDVKIWGVSLGWRDAAYMAFMLVGFYLLHRFGVHPAAAFVVPAVAVLLYQKFFD